MKIIGLVCICATLLSVTSCDKEEQSSLDKYWVSLATVYQTNHSGNFGVQFDNGSYAIANETDFKAENGKRVIINYSILSDSINEQLLRKIRINNINEIEIKKVEVLNAANQDSIGNDPVDIDEIWVGGNYLNVSFRYYGDKVKHLFSLVKNSLLPTATDGKTHLEFRQNAFSERYVIQNKGIISFDLKDFTNTLPLGNIQLVIEAKNYTGNVMRYELTYPKK
ncbi:NigD1/NigD2 family lipoprotein [Paludibacter jiangxiensis]|uniref:NigD-like protein n=1 Tax=Paludibacter jiangxiensis TaxID=681398 RepID=A0A170ZX20_9BACT|nr:NigD-like C-terminal domain-containing protein [Paludibacter jiangxiensis]GAT63100.1 NigD-like protein [Paludibacter jiangxiensis]